MNEVPKIVYDRLRVTSPERASSRVAGAEQTHPDANLLTAFAEQALSATERDGVLQHLAFCEDCREVLVLALPAVDAAANAAITVPIATQAESDRVARISPRAERTWLTMLVRPSMRWAALAAGVVVAASILLVHPGKLNQPNAPAVSQQTTTTAARPASNSPVASLSADQMVANAVEDARSSSRSLSSMQRLSKNPSASPSFEGSQMARNDAPAIQKAKPALQDNEATEAETLTHQTLTHQTSTHNVTWAITAGILQRSVDNGQNWQNALHTDHPLLCYASHGEDVWTGGQAGTIFHSVDSGVTWARVQPSAKDQRLSSNITHIDIRGDDIQSGVNTPIKIIVSTSNNQVWTSTDNGNTWQRN